MSPSHSGLLRLSLLACTSGLGGLADSVMSPYFCPLARSPPVANDQSFVNCPLFLVTCPSLLRSHGFGSSTCGHIISARFGTQVWPRHRGIIRVVVNVKISR